MQLLCGQWPCCILPCGNLVLLLLLNNCSQSLQLYLLLHEHLGYSGVKILWLIGGGG